MSESGELFEVVCIRLGPSTRECRSQLLDHAPVEEVFSLRAVRVGAHLALVDNSLQAIVEWWLQQGLLLFLVELPLNFSENPFVLAEEPLRSRG